MEVIYAVLRCVLTRALLIVCKVLGSIHTFQCKLVPLNKFFICQCQFIILKSVYLATARENAPGQLVWKRKRIYCQKTQTTVLRTKSSLRNFDIDDTLQMSFYEVVVIEQIGLMMIHKKYFIFSWIIIPNAFSP